MTDNPPERNNHTLFVVGELYNPPHLLLEFADQVRLEYVVNEEERYFAEVDAAGLWSASQWIRVRVASDTPYYWSERGLYYLELELWQKAANDFTEAIHLAPDAADYYFMRGQAYARLEKSTGAAADYRQFLALVEPPDAYQIEYIDAATEYLSRYGE